MRMTPIFVLEKLMRWPRYGTASMTLPQIASLGTIQVSFDWFASPLVMNCVFPFSSLVSAMRCVTFCTGLSGRLNVMISPTVHSLTFLSTNTTEPSGNAGLIDPDRTTNGLMGICADMLVASDSAASVPIQMNRSVLMMENIFLITCMVSYIFISSMVKKELAGGKSFV